MPEIPRDDRFDSSFALLRDPYRFISDRRRSSGSDLFEARLQFRKTICMTGSEAARLFYDPDRFMRIGAMPKAVQKTLLGVGGVQSLDDDAHRRRKHMFVSLLTAGSVRQMVQLAAEEWRSRLQAWAVADRIRLYPELQSILTRAACVWAGVPLDEAAACMRTRQIVALFDAAGSAGPRHLWSRWARKQADRWMATFVEQVRSGRLRPPEGSPAHKIAWHRDLNGELMPPPVAAVEMLNVIRPTVAVSVYMVLVAHALQVFKDQREKLIREPEYAELFVQEVRRYYPFFPAVAARTRREFDWRGFTFPAGRRVVLDLYGTNHDERSWSDPGTFDPDRFREPAPDPFAFIPQGGGNQTNGHRCPGEIMAIELMKLAADVFTQRIRFETPEQDLRIPWARMPAVPRSGFVVQGVQVLQ